MPQGTVTFFDGPWSGGGSQAKHVALGSLTTTGGTPFYADTIGYASRLYVIVTNGATNSVTYNVQGSWDGTTWFNLAVRADSSSPHDDVAVVTTGGSQAVLFLNPPDVPRYVRGSVGTANANGTTFDMFMER